MFDFSHVQFVTVDLDTMINGLFHPNPDDYAFIKEQLTTLDGNYFIIHAVGDNNKYVTLRIAHKILAFPEFMRERLGELNYFSEKQFVENLIKMTTVLSSKWAGEFCTQLSIKMGDDGVLPKPLPHGIMIWWNTASPCVQIRPLSSENPGVNDNISEINLITAVLGSHLLFWTIKSEVRNRFTDVVDHYHKIATN